VAIRAAVAAAIQVVAILFSLVGPVPINKRMVIWMPEALPDDWKAQEHRWDLYHWIRTFGLVVAFAILVLSVGAR
jgi:anthrone oxygenase-like protein